MENKAKECKVCGRLLTLDHFKKVSLAEDGHASHCKECSKKKRIEKLASLSEGGGSIVKDFVGGGNPELAKFHPRELMEELRFRGYSGKLRITREVEI